MHFAGGVCLQVVCNFLELSYYFPRNPNKRKKCIKSDVTKPPEKWKLED
jgi:hypothetical protein